MSRWVPGHGAWCSEAGHSTGGLGRAAWSWREGAGEEAGYLHIAWIEATLSTHKQVVVAAARVLDCSSLAGTAIQRRA